MRDFKKLEIWHLGMEIVELTYKLAAKLPTTEKYGLTSQMCRAAVSLPSNVAEGCGRNSNKDLAHFIQIAIGSAFELETQILIGKRVNYFEEIDIELIEKQVKSFQKASNSYRRRLLE